MGSGIPTNADFESGAKHPVVRRFLQMIARPDLRSEFPEQYEKHWENKGFTGTVKIIRCRIADHPCELVFSLYFNADEVVQTGIAIKYQGDALLNEVQKGDTLNFRATRRIDPIAYLRHTFTPAASAVPPNSKTYTIAVDDNSEKEIWRTVRQLTGRDDAELRAIWQDLLNSNTTRWGKDQVSPIISAWLRRERDRIDLQYLQFAQLLQPRAQEVTTFTAPGHTCLVVAKRLRGKRIREHIDAVDPEWWGGTFYRLNQGVLEPVAHEQKDRLLALSSFENNFEFPVEEIYIDNRHIYCVIFVGEEALVWRTRNQVAADDSAEMPVVSAAPPKGESMFARFKRKPAPAPAAPPAAEPPVSEAPRVSSYHVARAEKAYMAALQTRSPELKNARKKYLELLFDSDPGRFHYNPAEFSAEIQGTIAQALGKDAAAIQKESALVEAHVTIFYEERQ